MNNPYAHHESIWGRFVISREHYETQEILEMLHYVNMLSGRDGKINSVDIDLNEHPGVVCIWIDFPSPPLSGAMERLIIGAIRDKYELESGTWIVRELMGTRLAIWIVLPPELEEYLRAQDNDWAKRRMRDDFFTTVHN